MDDTIAQAAAAFAAGDPGRSVAICCESPRSVCAFGAADVLRPAASVMKLPLMMALAAKAGQGSLSLEHRLAIRDLPSTRYVSILAGFEPEHRLSLKEAMRLALITSDNPLVVALQPYISFAEVNALSDQLGLAEACHMAAGFSEDELGPKNRANVMTARAAIALFRECVTNPVYRDVLLGLENNLRNNRLAAELPDSAVVAHKTGSLNGVVNDAGYVRDGEIRFYIACLTDGQSDPVRTSADIARCASSVYAALREAQA